MAMHTKPGKSVDRPLLGINAEKGCEVINAILYKHNININYMFMIYDYILPLLYEINITITVTVI